MVPTFTIKICEDFFRKVLKKSCNSTFDIPHWIPKLNPPTSPYQDTPPTYKEIATAIKKSRSGASASLLDQLSLIILKRCPFLRTVLHAIIVKCWEKREIPNCWKASVTVLIYKKGDTNDPSNFRPISLQPSWYKILATIMKNKLFQYLNENNYLDKKLQKGFWPKSDGITEHTEQLSHIIRDAKTNNKGPIITLLDLRNAFGEVNHQLIRASLKFHHVPDLFIDLFNNIYQNSSTAITYDNHWTNFLPITKGVLQGDPASPFFFNLCFNTLMITLKKPEYRNLGYIWGPKNSQFENSWLQFADDPVILSHKIHNCYSIYSYRGLNGHRCRSDWLMSNVWNGQTTQLVYANHPCCLH